MPAGDACGKNEDDPKMKTHPGHDGRPTHRVRWRGVRTTETEVPVHFDQAFPSITTSLLTELAHASQVLGYC
jgi:hypothetical protein